jgi:uncharacterized protein YacL
MDLKKEFNKLCDPVKFYLLLSFASVVVYVIHLMGNSRKKYDAKEIVLHVALITIWTLILNKVCSFKYGVKISWFLVFLPVIFLIILVLLAYHFMDKLKLTKDDLHKMIKHKSEEDELEGFQGCGK